MPATNYLQPRGDYKLVRIRGRQAQILDPEVLGKILSILELHEEAEGPENGRPLWDALYRSQPFHSTQVDEAGAYWRDGNYGNHISEWELAKAFPWAAKQGHIASPPPPWEAVKHNHC